MDDFDPVVGPPAQELGSVPPPPPPGVDFDDPGEPKPDEPVPAVDELVVRSILAGLGNMGSMIDRAAPNLWRFTDDELDQIVPPFTRLANRNETLRRALLQGDYVVLALGFSSYAVRNVTARKEATDARQSRQAQRAPGPGAGQAALGVVGGRQPDAGPGRWGAADGPDGRG